MGKFKKNKTTVKLLNVPLDQQLSEPTQSKNRQKIRNRREDDDQFVDSGLSEKILQQARKQQQELEDETFESSELKINKILEDDNELSDEEVDALHKDEEDFYDNIEINEDDEKALEKFMNRNPVPRLTLADVINEKITEKQTELQSQFSEKESVHLQDLDSRVKTMYEGVRDVLARYRAGKIPKAFKIVPKLRNWEQILYITEPSNWSAAAVYMATRIFASNLKEKMAQRYYNLVLLPRIRDDIAEYKRLNFHLYQAMRKALYKPGAFMKGIILPLCESGTCTLREAIIIGSVIQKNSIPMLHSAAALLKIAEMDYNGANSIFLRILYDKKYALPYRVVDASVFHFLRYLLLKFECICLFLLMSYYTLFKILGSRGIRESYQFCGTKHC
ncbi:unnamed protein product [Nezara viridula]|uniref:Bystin n=1 Tax=Nezara viridula TaxID=85310 RepID=A0A9P0HQF3_NEZVI|nr:unnamed protein product [Nezara viridula]